MFENDILVAGADPGFGAIKLDIGDTKILFPAVICNGSERIFSTLGKTEPDKGTEIEKQVSSLDVIVRNNSSGVERHYFMGSLAESLNPKEAHYCWDEDKSTDEEAMALLIVALALAQPYPKTNIYLGTGVPVKFYAPLKDKYEAELKGSFSVTFLSGPFKGQTRSMNILRSRVLPQSYGVYIKETITEKAQPINPKLLGGYVVVIDPGFRTTDIATFYDGIMLDPPNSFSIEKGLQWAYAGVAEKLKEMTNDHTNPIETDDKELDKVFRVNKGLYPWNNGAIDLNPVMKKMLSQLAADISREVMKTLKPMAGRIHTVLVAGKVGEMVFEYLNLENKVLIDDPQFGNATGFRIMAANLVHNLTRKVNVD
ncbi:plasmid segregation actin-type ATPase ParM [Syntrophobotulus glycolicus DSM 8271]|uniref:Plasmid segregation actin-type ATPase ParM n=1 Tax=Syntrophobotulus glycolicus (strain DSM 8271 / FlGlyR) TaxID=645991 RepID=F0T058_SYNGF|nr:ParM/StbA family protein [Syntrophobotulus glycolicus]ADY56145.1 plasmid segregation actin-type ATPase ParM [Syntrophobotulus glycolicus DSM 8271]